MHDILLITLILTPVVMIGAIVWLIWDRKNLVERLEQVEKKLANLDRPSTQAACHTAPPSDPLWTRREDALPPSSASPPPLAVVDPAPLADAMSTFPGIKRIPSGPPPLPPEVTVAAAAKPAPPPHPQPPAPTAPTFDLPDWLRRLHLLPPRGETAEAALAAWWLTRIGLIILIIAAVFFGVRIARDVPPWVRVGTLVALSIAATWLGTWLEQKVAAFGRLLSAGGLALGFFTAFAAYSLEATQVIESPAVGMLAQAIAVAVAMAWSVWKQDENVGAMALLLGYVACGFSHTHDLDPLLTVGLLLLTLAGAGLHALCGWRWSLVVTVAGSWLGFTAVALSDWQVHAPPLGVLLGCLVAVAAMVEAGLILAQHRRHKTTPPWLRRLAVVNSSLAVGVTWIALHTAFPAAGEDGQWAVGYLTLTLMLSAFALARWRWVPGSSALPETYLLKASGLLALFFVERFDGPTRWISLSSESLLLVWAYRRSPHWLREVGAAAVWALAGGIMIHDAGALSQVRPWSALSAANGIGLLSIAFLSLALGCHQRWITETTPTRSTLRALAGVALGGIAGVLTQSGVFEALQRGGWLSLIGAALLILLPLALWRTTATVSGGLIALVAAFIGWACGAQIDDWSADWIVLGMGFSLLLAALAESTRRLWEADWIAEKEVRFLLATLAGSSWILTLIRARADDPSWLSDGPLLALAALGAATCVTVMERASRHPPPDETLTEALPWKRIAAVIAAGWMTWIAVAMKADHLLIGAALAIAAAAFGAVAGQRRSTPLAITAAVTLTSALGLHFATFPASGSVAHHGSAMLIIASLCVGGAVMLGRRRSDRTAACAALHGIALVVLHHWLIAAFGGQEVILLETLLASALWLGGREARLPGLRAISPLPLGLALSILLPGSSAAFDWSATTAGLGIASVTAALVWVYLQRPTADLQAQPPPLHAPELNETLGMLALTAFSFTCGESAWLPIAPLAAACLAVSLAHRLAMPRTAGLSLLPLAAGFMAAFTQISGGSDSATLWLRLSAVAVLVLAHGVLFPWSSSLPRSLSWTHGLAVIGLLFPVFASSTRGFGQMATVSWGVVSIMIFGIGLLRSLKPYRLVGLIGLALALIRMFAVDIDDGLHRIYAFFVIAVVLLAIGYLYHRFKDKIDRT